MAIIWGGRDDDDVLYVKIECVVSRPDKLTGLIVATFPGGHEIVAQNLHDLHNKMQAREGGERSVLTQGVNIS